MVVQGDRSVNVVEVLEERLTYRLDNIDRQLKRLLEDVVAEETEEDKDEEEKDDEEESGP
eukprot:CAMPEP_0184651748 /NCGR_PEP_ID=MMETSP0308-20130426/9403_1 /TAXON_ID=38269 /ORGANISM="Gloeochaete witrockiana, Strain SAG 46.84" /LENGTH=59 /DNA_ID=CAMNT_0027086191 /DNA_START=441 /DNA_END=616 /DNA_ORIENTATION=-